MAKLEYIVIEDIQEDKKFEESDFLLNDIIGQGM
jgi:hypothetical protein